MLASDKIRLSAKNCKETKKIIYNDKEINSSKGYNKCKYI
jgi:hypothetical protein